MTILDPRFVYLTNSAGFPYLALLFFFSITVTSITEIKPQKNNWQITVRLITYLQHQK